MVPQAYLDVLRSLAGQLSETGIRWVVTGSLGFALQGVPATPHDIDLQTDAAGAYAIERRFLAHSVRPVAFTATERMRSHFGALAIDGITVEIMGDIQKRLPACAWEDPVDLRRYRQTVDVAGMSIPVLALDYERAAYARLGRVETARMLDGWLHHRTASGSPRVKDHDIVPLHPDPTDCGRA